MKGASSLFIISATLLLAGALVGVGHAGAPGNPKTPPFQTAAKPILDKYCVKCHSGAAAAAGLDFTKFTDNQSVIRAPEIWQKAARYVGSNHMPPPGNPAPSPQVRAKLVGWIQQVLTVDCNLQDPGHVTIRRLNRAEYANTVRDLVGVDFKGTDDFPSDDVGYGFDNIGDVLSISPLLMEKYLNAAEQVARQAIMDLDGPTKEYDPSAIKFDGSHAGYRDDDLVLFSNGQVTVSQDFKNGGHCRVTVHAYGDQAGPDPCRMAVSLDNQPLGEVLVKGRNRSKTADFAFPFTVRAGRHTIGVAFTNDYYQPNDPDPHNRDRNLILTSIDIQGPQVPDFEISDFQRRYLAQTPAQGQELMAARALFKDFAFRAFRRPPTDDEVDRLAGYVALALKNGDDYKRGVQLGLEAALVSPDFLFRVEKEAKPNDSSARQSLNAYELASRLSYFLWSSMPDKELFDRAQDGSLLKPDVLVHEAFRMLQDPRADALANNFGAQWLTLRKLGYVTPDRKDYPDFNNQLRKDMAQETIDFFMSIVKSDGSVLDFLDGKYSYLNGRLAKLYGISGVDGNDFRRVSLEGTPREGVLTQASVLTVTSNPTRTSPVKRGKWVLEELLGTPPPPPPPGVGVLKEGPSDANLKTLRERMEAHRANPMCAACHARMDPLGFGLENFDGIGKWRTMDGTQPIDSSGQLPDGRKFNGPEGLISTLMGQKDMFVRCLSEKLLTYALGRGLTAADQCVIDSMVQRDAASGYKFSTLVKGIVLSDAFRMTRGDSGS